MGQKQKQDIIKYRTLHCLKRLKERSGMYVDELEYFNTVLSIIKQESTFLFKISNTLKVHRVQFRNETLTVLYNKKHSIVVTVFNNSWIGKKKDGSYFMKPRKQEKIKIGKSKKIHWKVKLKYREKERKREIKCNT